MNAQVGEAVGTASSAARPLRRRGGGGGGGRRGAPKSGGAHVSTARHRAARPPHRRLLDAGVARPEMRSQRACPRRRRGAQAPRSPRAATVRRRADDLGGRRRGKAGRRRRDERDVTAATPYGMAPTIGSRASASAGRWPRRRRAPRRGSREVDDGGATGVAALLDGSAAGWRSGRRSGDGPLVWPNRMASARPKSGRARIFVAQKLEVWCECEKLARTSVSLRRRSRRRVARPSAPWSLDQRRRPLRRRRRRRRRRRLVLNLVKVTLTG